MSQVKGAAVAVVALVIGLVIGLVVGLLIPFGQEPLPSTVTTTETVMSTTVETIVSTVTQATTPRTEHVVGEVLVSLSGGAESGISGARSEPFTATTSAVKIEYTVRKFDSHYEYSKDIDVICQICEVGKTSYIYEGHIEKDEGSFEDLCQNLTPGKIYYVAVVSVNAEWQVTVREFS